MRVVKNENLFYRGGGSDKVYTAEIVEKDGGYVVNFAYGRRGSTLRAGTKTQSPVTLSEAEKAYTEILAEKIGKGYQVGGEVASFVPTELSDEVVTGGIQLLNPIDEDEVEGYLTDDAFVAQPKEDGKRVQLRRVGGKTFGVNRKGAGTSVAEMVIDAVSKMPDLVLDGEMVGTSYRVFDLLEFEGRDWRTEGFVERSKKLQEVVGKIGDDCIQCVETAVGTSAKRALYERLWAEKREGIVFKRAKAPYVPGRPNSGGDQIKFKFYATATVRVSKVNKKRSVAIEMLNEAVWVDVGNVTVSAKHDVPEKGDLIEVRYLYAYEGGSLYQPTYLAIRDDLDEGACVLSQLKYKAVDEDDAE